MDHMIRLFQALGVIALAIAIGYSWVNVIPAQAQMFDPEFYHEDLRSDGRDEPCSKSGCWSQYQICCIEGISN